MMDRRALLQWLAASAAGGAWNSSAWSQVKLAGNPFTLGVASGSPDHESVVLWTRLMPEGEAGLLQAPVTVRWEVAHDEQFSKPVKTGQVQAVAALAHSVHAEVQGLEPDRWYFYRFIAGNAVSPVGRTRTVPAPDAVVTRLRLAYASCQRWEHGYFSAYKHMRAEEPDLVLFLGDYIYEYANKGKEVRGPVTGRAQTLDEFRVRYAQYKSEPSLQAMHAACPWVVVWDDHEVQNDYAGLNAGKGGTRANFAEKRAQAYQAFYEHMPMRASVLTRAVGGLASGAEMRIYHRLQYGRLASLMMLDARQYKDAEACTRKGKKGSDHLNPATCPEWKDPARSLLGMEQERWLEAELGKPASRQGGWSLIGQQTLFGQRDMKPGPGQLFWNDGWDGYSAARSRLTAALQKSAASNPILLGGDVHENWVGHVKADYANPKSAAVGVEFCGTSVTSHSPGNEKIPGYLAENPHFVFADSERKGYGMVEITPTRLKTSLRVVKDVTDPNTGIETLASFSVAAGKPVLERA